MLHVTNWLKSTFCSTSYTLFYDHAVSATLLFCKLHIILMHSLCSFFRKGMALTCTRCILWYKNKGKHHDSQSLGRCVLLQQDRNQQNISLLQSIGMQFSSFFNLIACVRNQTSSILAYHYAQSSKYFSRVMGFSDRRITGTYQNTFFLANKKQICYRSLFWWM